MTASPGTAGWAWSLGHFAWKSPQNQDGLYVIVMLLYKCCLRGRPSHTACLGETEADILSLLQASLCVHAVSWRGDIVLFLLQHLLLLYLSSALSWLHLPCAVCSGGAPNNMTGFLITGEVVFSLLAVQAVQRDGGERRGLGFSALNPCGPDKDPGSGNWSTMSRAQGACCQVSSSSVLAVVVMWMLPRKPVWYLHLLTCIHTEANAPTSTSTTLTPWGSGNTSWTAT